MICQEKGVPLSNSFSSYEVRYEERNYRAVPADLITDPSKELIVLLRTCILKYTELGYNDSEFLNVTG